MLPEYLVQDEITLLEYLNGSRKKINKIKDKDHDKLKQLGKILIFSCSTKVLKGAFDEATASAHRAALDQIIVSYTRII